MSQQINVTQVIEECILLRSLWSIVIVAPNCVITSVSKLYPGSVSDKAIVQQSGLLNHLTAENLVPADKGFLIEDLVPNGVSVNLPPFHSLKVKQGQQRP